MSREAGVFFGIVIPDYVTDGDVHRALNKAGDILEQEHITAEHMSITGIGCGAEEPEHIAQLRAEGANHESGNQEG